MMMKTWALCVCLFLPSLFVGCTKSEPLPTSASTQPTATPQNSTSPQPTTAVLPGWKKFAGTDVELQLPDTFTGGDPSKNLDEVVGKLKALGPNYQKIADTIEKNPTAFRIWAFDSQASKAGFMTNANVTTVQVPSNVTLDVYLDASVKQLPKDFRVVEQKIIPLERYQAGQLTTEFTIGGVTGKQVIYAIREGNTVWNIAYSTGADEFEQRLPTFQKSISTFTIRS